MMADEEIWCVMRPCLGKNGQHYIDADSIGTKKSASTFFNKNVARGQVIKITRFQAINVIIEDILDHDDEGLRLGNWVYCQAARKLKDKLSHVL